MVSRGTTHARMGTPVTSQAPPASIHIFVIPFIFMSFFFEKPGDLSLDAIDKNKASCYNLGV